MSARQEQLARLRRYRANILNEDPALKAESLGLGVVTEGFVAEAAPQPERIEAEMELESIAMRRERPVLAIRDNVTKLVFIDAADSEIWGERLKTAEPLLRAAIQAVGRINLFGGGLDWVGTGWLVADTILVTNRHVANEFVARKGHGFEFKMGSNGKIAASTDFLQEIDNDDELSFKLIRPLHVVEEPGPDVAFFEIELSSGDQKLAKPIALATTITLTPNIAVIGYPAYDSRIPEPDLMERIYGKVYNKKRLAPGGVTRIEETRLWHNCTTLGGNSGSLAVDLDTGHAVGLHFSGSFLKSNYAVRADIVKKLLDDVRTGRISSRPEKVADTRKPDVDLQAKPIAIRPDMRNGGSLTIPLTLNISLSIDSDALARPTNRRPPWRATAAGGDGDDFPPGDEAVASDYRDREGYDPDFLGDDAVVALPKIVRDAGDILEFDMDGRTQAELKYMHYSVVMNRRRRMCFMSACNINGNLSRKAARVGWKWDPRIPKSFQIMKECYGPTPRFSRGHMTRREDPGWGDDDAIARLGNEDSMHVTNATPQMQAFNAPIWLALEDYALQHAREDKMKISVFTGPYFGQSDPDMYGVRIPLVFWKIIAFIHDETGRLCATGYEMNQEKSILPETEFVFGAFNSPQLGIATQVSIRSIEARSGISFGGLTEVDPLSFVNESLEGAAPGPLMAMEEIRFL